MCSCIISGWRREVFNVLALLGFYAVYSGNYLPTCRDTLSVPSSGVKKSVIYRRLNMGPIVYTETAVRDYHYTLRNNPGDPRSELDVLVYLIPYRHVRTTYRSHLLGLRSPWFIDSWRWDRVYTETAVRVTTILCVITQESPDLN